MNMNAVKKTFEILLDLHRLDDYTWHSSPPIVKEVMIMLLEQCLAEVRGSELKPPEVISTAPKHSVTISMYPDTSGDYVCDGKNDDIEFKAALEYLQAISDSEQKEAE